MAKESPVSTPIAGGGIAFLGHAPRNNYFAGEKEWSRLALVLI
jgi:hypothetical protein